MAEKPLATDLADVPDLAAAAEGVGRFLMIGQHRRHNESFGVAQWPVAGCETGEPIALDAGSEEPGPR